MKKDSKKIDVDENSKLYLTGFRLLVDSENDCDFYTLYIDSEQPIEYNGSPIIFFQKEDISKALALSDCGCEKLPIHAPDDFDYIDIAFAIYELGTSSDTKDGNIVSVLNVLLDFVSFLHENRIHKEYKKLMREAANYFTFNGNIESYFSSRNKRREELVQAIEWAVGATLLWAKYIRPEY
jgi:hypothetical protein